LLDDAASLLFDHSTFNGHPRFFGYITAPAAPIGVLGDLLASAVNANVGGWALSPMASEIERQTVRWIAELIGFPASCGGLLASGGNMANIVCGFAARTARLGPDLRENGLRALSASPVVYVSEETHTWIDKAADLWGIGTRAVRRIPTDAEGRMVAAALRKAITRDLAEGLAPFLVVGNAGTVSTGAVDPLPEIAAICRERGLWFHVDGAYGAPAAGLPNAPADLKGLSEADSIAVDPHKWLYAPLEAGCALVRDPETLLAAFSYRPSYYRFEGDPEDPPINYFEWGLQNSRGFRALKVWLGLRHVGRAGARRMIADDIDLASELYRQVERHPRLEARTRQLSVVTFRYVPEDLRGSDAQEAYLDELNDAILSRSQREGEIFLSNAVVNGRFLLRACIVNFRTARADVEAVPDIVAKVGDAVDRELRPRAEST
jgi:glutamate/tyrosine decarboxylase-like PLP-dependent enzyme